MRNLISDLKNVARILTKNPLFTCVAILTLALGVGANTAISTLVNPMLLHLIPA